MEKRFAGLPLVWTRGPTRINRKSPEAKGLLLWVNAAGMVLPTGNTSRITLDHSDFGRHSTGTAQVGDALPGLAATEWGLQSIDFPANNTNIALNTHAYISNAAPFTVTWIARLDSFSRTFPTIAVLRSNVANDEGLLFYSNNGSYSDITFGAAGATFTNTKYIFPASISVTGEWHWGVFTYNGNGGGTAANFECYINGDQLSQSTASGLGAATPNDTNVLGEIANRSDASWQGEIVDFRVYDWEWMPGHAASFFQRKFDLYAAPLPLAVKAPAAVGGLGIPIAAYHYNHHLGTMQ